MGLLVYATIILKTEAIQGSKYSGEVGLVAALQGTRAWQKVNLLVNRPAEFVLLPLRLIVF